MHLHELIVQRRVGNRREVKNGVELLIAELVLPIARCQVLRYKVPGVTGEVLKITRAKIVDHSQPRVRKFFLQRQSEIGADKTGSAGDDEIGRRMQF